MIKSSSIDIYQLDSFVRSNGVVPDWMSMQLPLGESLEIIFFTNATHCLLTLFHLYPGRNMNECMLATKQLSSSYASRERNSSGSSHGDYSSINQAMRSPPTLQPSIHPPRPPSYHGSAILPRPAANGLLPGPATTTTAVTMPPTASPSSHRPSPSTTETTKPPPKKRGRPSRADRAKRELRPLLPQHLMPRPPTEQAHHQLQVAAQYPQHMMLPSTSRMQGDLSPRRQSPGSNRANKKRRRDDVTPERLPSVDAIMGVTSPKRDS